VAGEVYILLITNYSGLPTNISASQTAGTGSTNCSILCTMTNLTATPGACSPATNTYILTGTVTYSTPPSTGTLTITNSCSGATQVFNPPFPPTSTNYTLGGLPANGAGCTVTAVFSDDTACTLTTNFTAPPACTVTCNISSVSAIPTACDSATQQYSVGGSVTFANAPSTGTLTITNSCGGSPVVINAPFASPTPYGFTGLPANGANCNVTAVFSADATCTFTQFYPAPPPCTVTCIISSISAIPTACDSATLQYSLGGSITFTDPPPTGTLTITNSCGGSPIVINAPFASPTPYNFTALPATGANCDVTAVFSADASCTFSQNYLSPNPCTTNCLIGYISATPGTCDVATQSYTVSGDVGFVNPPASGTLTISNSCGGSPVILNPPFVSPAAYSFSGLSANGLICDITAVFSANATCTGSQSYAAPASCGTSCIIGSVTATPSACDPSTNTYSLSGDVTFSNAPASGTLTVSNSCGAASQTFNAPFTSPLAYNLPGLTSDGASCAITVSFSANAFCTYSQSYAAQPSCSACPVTASNNGPICAKDTLFLNATSLPGATYSWTGPGGFSSTLQNPVIPNTNTSDTGSYVVTISTTPACTSTSSTTFALLPGPVPVVLSDATVYLGTSATLVASGGSSYSWNPGTGLSCVFCNSTVATPDQTTRYCATVTDLGCSDSACVTVSVHIPCHSDSNLEVPNAFTPNGDTYNDEFCLLGWDECVSSFQIFIFDRWGERVYESQDPSFCWNGYFKGKSLDPGVYIYFIKATYVVEGATATDPTSSRELTKKGNISLVR
jgi:gliding motility-associated-like protein